MNQYKQKQREIRQRSAPALQCAARELKPVEDLTAYIQEYARQRPDTVALACIGVGFILGWKLKLW